MTTPVTSIIPVLMDQDKVPYLPSLAAQVALYAHLIVGETVEKRKDVKTLTFHHIDIDNDYHL